MHLNAVVAQRFCCIVPVIGAHHQAPWKYTDSALQNAHVYVHFKAVYTLALKQGLSEGDGGHIGRAHQLFHANDLGKRAAFVERRKTEWMGFGPKNEQTA